MLSDISFRQWCASSSHDEKRRRVDRAQQAMKDLRFFSIDAACQCQTMYIQRRVDRKNEDGDTPVALILARGTLLQTENVPVCNTIDPEG